MITWRLPCKSITFQFLTLNVKMIHLYFLSIINILKANSLYNKLNWIWISIYNVLLRTIVISESGFQLKNCVYTNDPTCTNVNKFRLLINHASVKRSITTPFSKRFCDLEIFSRESTRFIIPPLSDDWKAWKMGIEKALRLVKDLPRVALNNIKNSPMDQKKPVGIKKML